MNKVLLWLALATLLLAGCGDVKTAPDDPSARQAVTDAFRAQIEQPYYQIRSVVIAEGEQVESRLEYQSPDRFHITDASGETVIIGEKALTLQNSAWVDAGAQALAMVAGINDPSTVDAVDTSMVAARLIGPATFENQPVNVYEYQTKHDVQGTEVTFMAKIWISDPGGLPLKREAEIRASDATTTLVTLYSYDPAVTVEDPTAP